MKFTNIDLANGISGARDGQGMKRGEAHYVASSGYGIGISGDTTDTDTDFYVVYNEWPTLSGANANSNATVSSTDLATLGINRLDTRAKATHVSGSLDMAIIRKTDRKGVRITVTGSTVSHYKIINPSNSSTTITAIDPIDGPWTPETGRLVSLGYA